jgi:hypothetical protein
MPACGLVILPELRVSPGVPGTMTPGCAYRWQPSLAVAPLEQATRNTAAFRVLPAELPKPPDLIERVCCARAAMATVMA